MMRRWWSDAREAKLVLSISCLLLWISITTIDSPKTSSSLKKCSVNWGNSSSHKLRAALNSYLHRCRQSSRTCCRAFSMGISAFGSIEWSRLDLRSCCTWRASSKSTINPFETSSNLVEEFYKHHNWGNALENCLIENFFNLYIWSKTSNWRKWNQRTLECRHR